MTIKLNEFDRKLLSSIKPSDTWNKLKNIYTINGEVKRLKIGNNKIGIKCAQHLRKLSNKSDVTLNEIKDGCKDLIPKKHKHGLKKTSGKADVLKEHTKIDIGQDKPPPPKVKKPPKPRQPSATQQLVNLLSQQQLIAKKQTVQRQIQEVDKILTDRNKNVELPNQTPQLQLTRQPLGSQVQDNSANLRMRLLEGSLLDRERGLAEIASNLDNQKKLLKERLRNPSLLQRQPRLQLTTQAVGQSPIENQDSETVVDKSGAFRSLTNKLTDKDKNKRQDRLLTDITSMGQNQRTKKNQKIFEDLTRQVETQQRLDTLQQLSAERESQQFIASLDRIGDEAQKRAQMREEIMKLKDLSGGTGLQRTTSASNVKTESLLERMEADSLRSIKDTQDLQRTLSAPDLPTSSFSQVQKRIKEQQESEAIFNKQKKLANQIKNEFMGFGDDEDKPLSQEELDKLKSIAEEEPSMEEKPSPRGFELKPTDLAYFKFNEKDRSYKTEMNRRPDADVTAVNFEDNVEKSYSDKRIKFKKGAFTKANERNYNNNLKTYLKYNKDKTEEDYKKIVEQREENKLNILENFVKSNPEIEDYIKQNREKDIEQEVYI